MAYKNFKKEDFVKINDNEYQIEYRINEIGEGIGLTVERRNPNDEYEIVQAEIKRLNDSIFVSWSEPFDGRIIYEN